MLTVQQLLGFVIVIASILCINYEKDSDDIGQNTKKFGMIIQITAIILSSFGIVLMKPVLAKVNTNIFLQLWITAFRLLPGFIIAWIIFLFQKNKKNLLAPLKKSNILWKIIISSGLGTFIALSFWIVGYTFIEKPPIASILGQTSVIIITILSYIVLKEKVTRFRFLIMWIAIIGVLLITIK